MCVSCGKSQICGFYISSRTKIDHFNCLITAYGSSGINEATSLLVFLLLLVLLLLLLYVLEDLLE